MSRPAGMVARPGAGSTTTPRRRRVRPGRNRVSPARPAGTGPGASKQVQIGHLMRPLVKSMVKFEGGGVVVFAAVNQAVREIGLHVEGEMPELGVRGVRGKIYRVNR